MTWRYKEKNVILSKDALHSKNHRLNQLAVKSSLGNEPQGSKFILKVCAFCKNDICGVLDVSPICYFLNLLFAKVMDIDEKD